MGPSPPEAGSLPFGPSARFISEPIEVNWEGPARRPTAFLWRGERLEIASVLRMWHDWRMPKGNVGLHTWRSRRHRNHYEVLTATGRTFELYLDRKTPTGDLWVLLKEIAGIGEQGTVETMKNEE